MTPMPHDDPMLDAVTAAGGELMAYGPPPEEGGVAIAEHFGAYEAEYAAIRRRVGVMHLPHRGILRGVGGDVKDFLHRLMTQDIASMAGGSTRRSFQLNAKGRVVADCVVHFGDADTWIETDRYDLDDLRRLLDERLFADDVTLEDWRDERVWFAVLGPASVALLQQVADERDVERIPEAAGMPGTHHVVKLGDAAVSLYRWDDCGVPGLRVACPPDRAVALYERLLDAAGYDPADDAAPDAETAAKRRASLRGRPVGWLAYNTARIEAGTPVAHVDFGPDSLPAETGLLDQAVSFTTGCYLGQEIVARMKSLGHPRRLLVGLKFPGDAQPVSGTQVLAADAATRVVGGITSSTVSPMLGQTAIAFAVVKWGHHRAGSVVKAPIEGELVDATVQPTLNFLAEA